MKNTTPPPSLAAARGFLSILAAVALVCFASTARAADGTWISSTNANWNVAANWTGSVIADGAGYSATVDRSNFTGARTLTLNASRTLGSIHFVGIPAVQYNAAINGPNTLTLNNSGSPSVISNHGWGAGTVGATVIMSLVSDLQLINGPTNNVGDAIDRFLTIDATVSSAGGLRTITTLPSTSVPVTPADPNNWRIVLGADVTDGAGQVAIRHASGYNLNLQTAAKTFTGGLYIKTGAVRTSALGNSTLGGAGNVITFEARGATDPDAVLVFHGAMTEENATVNRAAVLEAGGVIYVSEDVLRTVNWTGVISGAGSLNKAGPGDLRLSGANTYTGDTIVTGGTLSLGGDNAIAPSNALTLGGGVLNAAGHSQTFAGLTLTADAAIELGSTGASTLAFGNSINLGAHSLALTGTAEFIRFGTDATALTADELLRITLNGQPVALDGSGNLSVAPAALAADKVVLALGQGAGGTATLNISGNVAWTISVQPSGASDWLSVSESGGAAGPASVTVTASTANTAAAPRHASILVSGGGITHTVLVAQLASPSAGAAPAAFTAGTLLTLSIPKPGSDPEVHNATIIDDDTLDITDEGGSDLHAYEYHASGDVGTLILDDMIWSLNFASNEFRAYVAEDEGPVEIDGNLIYTPTVAPAITTQPESITRADGANAAFTVAASGNPAATYQWQSSTDGTTWNDIPGKTDATLSLIAALSMNGMQYRSVATNTLGSATSNAATLTVTETPVTVTVTFDPQSGSLGEQPATATVTPGSAYGSLPAPTRSEFDFGGWWTAINGGGTQITADAIVAEAVNHTLYAKWTPSEPAAVAPAITTQPVGLTRADGENATFTVAATGTPAPTYQWQSSTDGTNWTDISGKTDSDLSLTAAASLNGVQYRCVATNSAGSATSNAATLTVTTPPVVSPELFVDKTMLTLGQAAGSTASFNVSGNVAWTSETQPASDWLSVSPASGPADTDTDVILATLAENTTGAPRNASVIVSGSDIVRTVIVTQLASAAAGAAPATLAPGTVITLTIPGDPDEVHTATIGENGTLTIADEGSEPHTYEYQATGDTGTLIFDDMVWALNFASGNFRVYGLDEEGAFEVDGTFTYDPPVAAAYTLTVTNGTGGGSYAAGEPVLLIASAAPSGKVFDKWTSSAGGTFANETAETTVFTMPANATTVTAAYKDQPAGGGNNSRGGGGGAPSLLWLGALAGVLALRALRKER